MKISEQTQIETISLKKTPQQGVSHMLIAACLFELCYLLLVAVSPLPQLHLSNSPIAWSWILFPSHLLGTAIGASNAWLAPPLLGLIVLGLLATYAYTIRRALHLSRKESANRHWLLLLLSCALLFSLTLLFQPKLFSDDVFTYIFSGRILTFYHADPLNTAPAQFPADPYLQWVIAGRNTPNIYGPLWYCIASLLVSIGKSPIATLLLFKGLAILSNLLNIVLVWSILNRIAPNRGLLGTLLYAWNPLILIELAGSGHNEGILLTFLLLATWLYVSSQKLWSRCAALLLFGLALSMNLIVLLLIPLLIWFDVRSERHISYALWSFCWRLVLVLAPALAIWLPFWRGASTFFAITSAIDMQHFVHSPIGILVVPTHLFFELLAYVLRFPWPPIPAADVTLRGMVTFIFALIYSNLFGQVRHAPFYRSTANSSMEVPGVDVLLKAWNIAIFAYLLLVSGWFWPWYLLELLWIVVLRPLDAFTSTALVLSATALFFYLFLGIASTFSQVPFALYQPAFIFGIPLVYLVLVSRRQRHSRKDSYST